MNSLRRGELLRIVIALAGVSTGARANENGDFYRGKTLEIVVGFEAGGGYDAYARLIARHIGKYIPGVPSVIVQNMPGAGSRVAANWLYNVAPEDGSVIGTVVQSTAVDQVLGEPGIKFNAAKFSWIGNPIVDNLVTLATAESGFRDLQDVKAKGGLICGSTGAGPTLSFPNIISKLLPTQARIVSGYPGVAAISLAMDRGEVNCNGGNAWSSVKATMGEKLRDHKFIALVQWGMMKDPEISAVSKQNVALITDYARSDADREALRLMTSTSALSRPLLAPPNIPADRIKVLRVAFDATMKDADFRRSAAAAGMDIKPISGADIQGMVAAVVASPPEGLKRAQELVQ